MYYVDSYLKIITDENKIEPEDILFSSENKEDAESYIEWYKSLDEEIED